MDGVSAIDWQRVAADLAPIECIAARAVLRTKSRDFFWYSPVLNEKLKGVSADLVVCPANEAEIVRTLAYCHAHRIPVTPRGGGTGNYGQAMPLKGGIVLDLLRLNRFLWLKDGVARVEAGLKLIDLENHSLPQGWELRFHPSTRRTATIGGQRYAEFEPARSGSGRISAGYPGIDRAETAVSFRQRAA